MIMRKLLSGIIVTVLLLAGCSDNPPEVLAPEAGPKLLSCSLDGRASDITGEELSVILTFDQNVKTDPYKHGNVAIDNGATVAKVRAYNEKVTVEIASLEENGKTYTLVIPKGVILGFKEHQEPADEILLNFTMKGPYVPSELDPVKTLSNPNASPQAKNVYDFLLQQSGKKTLSGVQSSHSNKNDFVDAVYKHTGKHPALAGFDFIFTQYSPTPDSWSWVQNYNDISAAKEQWSHNGLVSYMWHWNVPTSEAIWKNALENYGEFDGYAFYSDQTSFDIKEALKPGTWQNDFIMRDIEEIAGYLQLLEDEGIPVIWRPLHEAAGNYGLYEGGAGAWFWWGRGGAEPCKQLWRLLYDQLVNVHGLDNLIWVWTVDIVPSIPYAQERNLDWYPGDEYVDILGVDIYADNTDAKTEQYQALVDMVGGKRLVTVSECGNIPDPAKCFEAGNKWSWWMVWPSADADGNIILTPDNWPLNTADYWKKVISSPYTLNREDMPDLSF